jgi:hypothetical protein
VRVPVLDWIGLDWIKIQCYDGGEGLVDGWLKKWYASYSNSKLDDEAIIRHNHSDQDGRNYWNSIEYYSQMNSMEENEPYEPTDLVRAGLHIPRLTPQLTPSTDDFANLESDPHAYLMSVATFPIIITCIMVAALMIYQIALMVRWYYPDICCTVAVHAEPVPVVATVGNLDAAPQLDVSKHMVVYHPWLMGTFYLFLMCTFVATFWVIAAYYEYLVEAIEDLSESLTVLGHSATAAKNVGQSLLDAGQRMQMITGNHTTCLLMSTLLEPASGQIDSFVEHTEEVMETVGTLPALIYHIAEAVGESGYAIEVFVFTYFSLVIALVIALLVTAFVKDKGYLNVVIGTTELLVLLIALIAGFELFGLVRNAHLI